MTHLPRTYHALNLATKYVSIIYKVYNTDGCLFCTAQDTIFFIFIVDSLTGIAALGTEIEVAMEVENEHRAEVAHLRVLRVRRKGRRLCLLRGEWQLCRNTVKCYC